MRSTKQHTPIRAGRPWSGVDLMRLSALAEKEIPVHQIARRLQRSESAVKAEAARQRLKIAAAGARSYDSSAPRRTSRPDPPPSGPASETLF